MSWPSASVEHWQRSFRRDSWMWPAMRKALQRRSTIPPLMRRTHWDLGWAVWPLPRVLAGPPRDGSDVGSHSAASQPGLSQSSPTAAPAWWLRGKTAPLHDGAWLLLVRLEQ